MAKDIQKHNLKDMLKLVHVEMKRIQNLKCPADLEMVKKHSETLENLQDRTARIEAAAYTTIALITAFGIVLGFIEYSSRKAEKDKPAQEQIIAQQGSKPGIRLYRQEELKP
ncbi:MAG TPA: hypothetical protein DET40_10115 [Lentisphaeria bacterium]|nr:MAG: hypothetical protein A2X45_21775 [Lentisphaerae bacterium GWF2_50_93]HCE43890.1 hypothetical protein [Lentisphaeria bacterium]